MQESMPKGDLHRRFRMCGVCYPTFLPAVGEVCSRHNYIDKTISKLSEEKGSHLLFREFLSLYKKREIKTFS
jgi:hypothetical protein